MTREQELQQLEDSTPWDILIIGGGATGLGCALDAASRGHRVALIEQEDFAAATSSRSTKLIHGGVRYLRQGNVRLVREALLERERLLQNASSLVHPLPFIIPNDRKITSLFYRAGLGLYDTLAGKTRLPKAKRLNVTQTLQRLPGVNPQKCSGGGVCYYDAQFDDARLALTLALTAKRQGALVLNYCRCLELIKENGRTCGAMIEDRETGKTFPVKATCVINATGIFSDNIRRKDDSKRPPMLAVSQGIHLVLPRHFSPGNTAFIIPKTDDGRVLFGIPWENKVLFGTTDTPMTAPALEPKPLEHEIEYLLSYLHHYLTQPVSRKDVCSMFAGLRPLVQSTSTEKTAHLSREHHLEVSDSKLISIMGGKWTTYRAMAEAVINQAEISGDLPRQPCVTAAFPLNETRPHTIQNTSPNIHPRLSLTENQIRYSIQHEMARTITDCLSRRYRCMLLDASATQEAAPRVADIIAAERNLTNEQRDHQLKTFNDLITNYICEKE